MSVRAALVRVLGAPLVAVAERDGAATADAVVVLGSPVRGDGTLTDVGEERVRAGVALWRRGAAPVVCMTGGATRGGLTEAEAMAARARELGVPAAALRVERAAQNTAENALYCKWLLDGAERVWVVTTPFHMRRALMWFRRVGFVAMAWHIDESVQYRQPKRGLRWVVREYLGLLRDGLRLRDPK